MQEIKLNFSRGKATIVLDRKIVSFEIDDITIVKLKDYVLKYNFKPTAFWLKRIEAIVTTQLFKVVKPKDYTKKIASVRLVTELDTLVVDKSELEYFEKSPLFTVQNKTVCLKGFNFALPETFLKTVKGLDQDKLNPYINFMYNLSSNPNKQVRENIWDWVLKKGFKITQNGYIYAIRWVVKKEGEIDNNLNNFVELQYQKVKKQKKSPKNYIVYRLGKEYYTIEIKKSAILSNKMYYSEIIGNLSELYDKPISSSSYTDEHTGKFEIKIGVPVTMNRSLCDESVANCSSGLHLTSFQDISNINFGNEMITCLVSAKNIVSMPGDSYKKFRCCEYYPYAVVNKEELETLRTSDFVIDDVDYETINLDKVLVELSQKTDLYPTNKDKIKRIKEQLKNLNKSTGNLAPELFSFDRIITL